MPKRSSLIAVALKERGSVVQSERFHGAHSRKLLCGLGGALSGLMAIPGAPILGAVVGGCSGSVGRIPFASSKVESK